ncbi:MAG: hypothetical protein WCK42_00710 [Myxococcaceae bacterium]
MLLLFSTTLLSQNLTKTSNRYCFYADASEKIVGTFAPAAWSVWGTIYGLLPTIAEVVISLVTAKMRAVPGNPEDPIATEMPAVQQGAGNNFLLTMAHGLRSPRFETASNKASAAMGWTPNPAVKATTAGLIPGSSNDAISLTTLAVINMVFYIMEQFFKAECDYESQ